MAINDNAVVTAAKGYVFTAPVGTASPAPADISAFDPDVGFPEWENIGHTARDELPEFGFDGGDAEPRGTWQNSALKTVVAEPPVDYVTVNLHQWDENTLKLYYGVSDPGSTAGEFEVADTTTDATQKALLVVIVDGDATVAFYAPKTDIRREDAIELTVDEFAILPIRATFLKSTGKPLFKWISEDFTVNDGVS